MAPKIQHKRSAVKGKAPQPSDLEYGELAVNYESTDPGLFIKDSADAVVKIAPAGAASETAAGVIEIATATEAALGTDTTRAVTPATMAAVVGAAVNPGSSTAPTSPSKGAVYINGGTVPAVLDAYDGSKWISQVGTAVTGGTAPTTPAAGMVWIDSSTSPAVYKMWDGAAWFPLSLNDATAAHLNDQVAQVMKRVGTVVSPAHDGDTIAVQAATETVSGIVELATAAETTTGTDNTRAVHPAGLKVELDKKLNLAGGNLTGGVTQTERTITAAFDLATGNFWTCGAIAIPAATNAVAGMSGLIRLTAAPTGWDAMFKHAGGAATAPTAFPAIVPFYVVSATEILVGKPVEGMA